jgi:hypothetical protein
MHEIHFDLWRFGEELKWQPDKGLIEGRFQAHSCSKTVAKLDW